MSTIISRSIDATVVEPRMVLDPWESENEPGTKVHSILGRPDVDVTLAPARDRTGTLRLLFWDAVSAEAARKFHTAAATFSAASDLPWVPARYVPNGTIALRQQPNRNRWVLEVPFQELAP